MCFLYAAGFSLSTVSSPRLNAKRLSPPLPNPGTQLTFDLKQVEYSAIESSLPHSSRAIPIASGTRPDLDANIMLSKSASSLLPTIMFKFIIPIDSQSA